MIVRVVVCQLPLGQAGLTLRQKLAILRHGGDFVCLPEYFMIPPDSTNYAKFADRYDANIDHLAKLSGDLNATLIAGSIVARSAGKLYNTCFVFSHGYRIGAYQKMFPTVGEMERGISQGSSFASWTIDGIRVGVLLCADVLRPESFDEMGRRQVDVTFAPTISPYKPDDTPEEKQKRDEGIYVRGASNSGSYVVKVCATGCVFGKRLQGRSLVAAPWKLLWGVPSQYESTPIINSVDLDIDRLREHRRRALIERLVTDARTA
jgi:predicted amidohydrolase